MYPPEPEITYGVFDRNYYAPIRAGHQGDTLVGWGIGNLPPKAYGTVVDNENSGELEEYLRIARSVWENQCLQMDFDAVENPLTLLVGLTLTHVWIYADQLGFHFRANPELDPLGTQHSIAFNYAHAQCVTGMMASGDVRDHIYTHVGSIKVDEVEDDIITLSTGVKFAITPRFDTTAKPVVDAQAAVKRLLIKQRNLVSMPATQDSELEPA